MQININLIFDWYRSWFKKVSPVELLLRCDIITPVLRNDSSSYGADRIIIVMSCVMWQVVKLKTRYFKEIDFLKDHSQNSAVCLPLPLQYNNLSPICSWQASPLHKLWPLLLSVWPLYYPFLHTTINTVHIKFNSL